MKFENRSEFPLIILVGISEYWVALLSFNRLISVSICLRLTSLKLKAPPLLYLILIARMLGCFLYLRIAFKVRSLTFSIIGSKLQYWEMLKFCITKKLLKTSAASCLVFTTSPFSFKFILSLALNFSDSEGFTVFSKKFMSEIFLSSNFS